MKIKSFFLAIPILVLFGCDLIDFGLDNDIPKCIRKKIKNFESEVGFKCSEGAFVEKYLFQERYVYVFNAGNCGADFTSPVFDESCNELGKLGGISGNLEIDGLSFENNAETKGIVWQD